MNIRVSDLAVFGSIGSIAYGCWLVYQPAAFIVGGSLGLALSLAVAAKVPRK